MHFLLPCLRHEGFDSNRIIVVKLVRKKSCHKCPRTPEMLCLASCGFTYTIIKDTSKLLSEKHCGSIWFLNGFLYLFKVWDSNSTPWKRIWKFLSCNVSISTKLEPQHSGYLTKNDRDITGLESRYLELKWTN